MADSPRRNHGSLCSSRQFCNKIGPTRTSSDVRFGAAVKGKADIKRALIRSVPTKVIKNGLSSGALVDAASDV
jgi:hypothetical protein